MILCRSALTFHPRNLTPPPFLSQLKLAAAWTHPPPPAPPIVYTRNAYIRPFLIGRRATHIGTAHAQA